MLAFTIVVIGVTAPITAVVTAAVVRPPEPPSSAYPTAPAMPQYSAAEQAAAKQAVCRAFDEGERGNFGQGGVVKDGELNVALVLRMVNAVAAVQNRLVPATPDDVSVIAKNYIATEYDLTTAALARQPIDKLVELTKTNNAALYALADACGIPR